MVVAAIALTATLASLTVVPAVAEPAGPAEPPVEGVSAATDADGAATGVDGGQSPGGAGGAIGGRWNILPFPISSTATGDAVSACFLDPPPGLAVETCTGPSQGNFGIGVIFRASEGLCGRGTNGLAVRHNTAMGLDHSLSAYSLDPTRNQPSSLATDAVVETCPNAGALPDALDTTTGASNSKNDIAVGLLRTSYAFPDGQNGRLTRYPTTTPAWPTGTFTVNPGQSFADIDNKGLWEFIDPTGRSFGGGWFTPAVIDPLVVGNNDVTKSWNLMGSDLPGICDPTSDPYVDNGGNVWPWNLSRVQHCMYAVDQSSATAILFNTMTIDDPADPFARYDIEYSPRFAWAPESWRNLVVWLSGGSTEWEIKRFRPAYMVDTVYADAGGATCIWRAGEGRLDRGGCNVDSAFRSGSMLAFDVPWSSESDPTMLPQRVFDRFTRAPDADLTIETTADLADPAIGDGHCGSLGTETCSLRAAIQEANARPGADEILVPAGTYTLSIEGRDEDGGATGDLDVRDPLTITGAGAASTIIDANGIDRVLDIGGVDLDLGAITIDGVTITGGQISDAVVDAVLAGGGGIRSHASELNLRATEVVGNAVDQTSSSCEMCALGGGVLQSGAGAIVVEDVVIADNEVRGDGASGGGLLAFGPVTLLDTTVTGNEVQASEEGAPGPGYAGVNLGAGVAVVGPPDQAPVPVLVDGATITGNRVIAELADGVLYGGGLALSSVAATVRDTIIVENGDLAVTYGAGILLQDVGVGGSTLTIDRTVIADNHATGLEILGSDDPEVDAGEVTVTSSQLSGNNGGVWVGGSTAVSMEWATVTDNQWFGLIVVGPVPIVARSSVLGPQGGSAHDCWDDLGLGAQIITSVGAVADSDGTCELTGPSDRSNVDTKLVEDTTSFAQPVWVPALGSPLLDAGGSGCPAMDLVGGVRPLGLSCDIGAVEAVVAMPSFSDVPSTHPFFTEIGMAAWYGWVGGYADGTFRPSQPVSRQAAMAVLWRRAGSPSGPFDVPAFDDVPAGHPFETAIDWAVATGVTTGYADGGFHPTAAVSRQAGVTWLWRLEGAPPGPFEGSIFSDVGAGHRFETPISWAVAEGVTDGYADGTFRPLDAVTRQALVAWLIPT